MHDPVPVVELDGVAASPKPLAALALTNYDYYTSMRVEEARVSATSPCAE
jgi:hypothetical protein